MRLITGLLDRLLFAAGLALFLQIPQFIDHYTQRYGGYRQSVADSVAEYQRSADQHYGGNLEIMTQDFRTDDKPAMREMGDKIFSDLFTLRSDIGNPILRQTPIGQDGLARAVRIVLVTNSSRSTP